MYSKFRSEGRRRDWEAIRADVKNRARGKCHICKAAEEKGMVCHEKWTYDYSSRKATLTNFALVCPLCNFSVHLGRTASVIAERKPEILDEVIKHIAEVNDMTKQEVDELVFDSFIAWMLAPGGRWKVTIDPGLVDRYPQLKGLKL